MTAGFEYETWDDAPPEHKLVVWAAVDGRPQVQIAKLLNLDRHTVSKVLSHAPMEQYLEEIQRQKDALVDHFGRAFDEIVKEAAAKHLELLRNPLTDAAVLKDLIVAGYNHHPSGRFAKQTKQQTTHEVKVVTDDALRALQEQAMTLGLRDKRYVLPASPQPVETPEGGKRND